MEIKVGDKVRVREDAPRMYLRTMSTKFLGAECGVFEIIDGNAAIASGRDYIAIPLKYLVKVEEEKKEAKFKVGDVVRYRLDGKRYEVMGKTGKYHYALNGYDSDVLESDLEPYTEPTEEKKSETHQRATVISMGDIHSLDETRSRKFGSITIPVKVDLDETYWSAYAADLAKEIALKVANKKMDNHPEEIGAYAVSVAKAVAEGLKRK